MRESDSELFKDTSVFVDTSEALIKSGCNYPILLQRSGNDGSVDLLG